MCCRRQHLTGPTRSVPNRIRRKKLASGPLVHLPAGTLGRVAAPTNSHTPDQTDAARKHSQGREGLSSKGVTLKVELGFDHFEGRSRHEFHCHV